MALVYLDMMKLAVPASIRQSVARNDAQYIAFGSYDLLYYALPASSNDGLDWLEQKHEDRHELDWNYERHPVYMYCSDALYGRLEDVVDSGSHETCPLVLTMARVVKHPLASYGEGLDDVLAALQATLESLSESLLGDRIVACWNLGNADFIILSRPKKLSSLRDLYLKLGAEGFGFGGEQHKGKATRFTSFSSYCAFPTCKVTCGEDSHSQVNEGHLREWLETDADLRFVDFVETVADLKDVLNRFGTCRFLFGDRDYQLVSGLVDQQRERIDAVMSVVGELLDPTKEASIHTSTLIPCLDLESVPAAGAKALPKTYGLTWKESESVREGVASKLEDMRSVVLNSSGITEQAKEKYDKQLVHGINTLDALYKYAIRLYAAAYEDDVFLVVMGLYSSLSDILDSCLNGMCRCLAGGNALDLERAVASIYFEIMRFVSELQHIYTVLAISPHSYMETYYGSMRSLNASSKLWISYSGVVETLCRLYPTYNLGELQSCRALLIPYREKSSRSRRIVPKVYSKSILVYIQLNYQKMFETRSTIFVIAHELGHYIYNVTRAYRAQMMLMSSAATAVQLCFADVLSCPLYALTSSLKGTAESGIGKYKKCLSAAVAPDRKMRHLLERLCVNICGDIDKAVCDALYRDMTRALRKRYQKKIDAVVEGCLEDYIKFYGKKCLKNLAMSYCMGNDVTSAIAKHLNKKRARYLRRLSFGISKVNVRFLLDDLPKYERRYSVHFDRQQVIKLVEYWTYVVKSGPLSNDLGIKIQPDITRYVDNYLAVFREIHSDIFACKALEFDFNDYLSWISSFVDSSPCLIANSNDLHRILVVCGTAFRDDGSQKFIRWIEHDDSCPFGDDVRSVASRQARSIRSSLHYRYLFSYGVAVARSMDSMNTINKMDSNKKKMLDGIRGFAAGGAAAPQSMWQFWLKSMDMGGANIR